MKKIKITQIDILAHGQFVSLFGDTVFSVALPYIVLKKTGSTAIMASMNSVSMIFRIITSFFAGPLIDNSNKKKIIIYSDILRGFVIVTLAVLLLFKIDYIVFYYLAMIILGITSSLFKPAINSTIVDIADENNMEKENAKINNSGFIADILGNAFCSYAFSLISPVILVFMNGISYIYSAITEIFLKIPYEKKERKNNYLSDLLLGYKYVMGEKALLIFIGFCMSINFFLSMIDILYLPYFETTSSFGVKGYSYAMMAFSVGTVFISSLISHELFVIKKRNRNVFLFTLLYALLSIFVLGFDSLIMYIVVFFGLGICHATRQTILVSALQRGIDRNHKGMAFSFYSMALNIFKPISYLVGGVLADLFNIKYLFCAVFIGSVICAVVFTNISFFAEFIERKENSDITVL